MSAETTFIINTIGAVIGGKAMPQPNENIDWDLVYKIAKAHNVANLLGYAVKLGNFSVPVETGAKLQKAMFSSVIVDENQKAEFSKLFLAFSENKIKFMRLKGLVVKGDYPSGDMRNMSDGDILIDETQRDKIDAVMQNLGYTFKTESNHELVYQKPPYVTAELHKILVPSYNDDLYAYYGDGWKLAKQMTDYEWTLSDDDHFIYMIVHFAKHYRDGGAGIKYIADLWLYSEKHELDLDYIFEQLLKMGLAEFARNLLNLAAAWFAGGELDEVTASMTEYILGSGQYGNVKNASLARALRDNQEKSATEVSKGRLLSLAFPNLSYMQKNYPVLEKSPYLLPVLWVWRWIRIIIGKTDRRNMKKISYLSGENLTAFDQHIKSVGLDIYNGRKKP